MKVADKPFLGWVDAMFVVALGFWIPLVLLLLIGGLSLVFCAVSLGEREARAARLALGFTIAAWLSAAGVLHIGMPGSLWLAWITGITLAGVTLFVVIPFPPPPPQDAARHRVDERDIAFARARLKKGSAEFETYYRLRPENLAEDDKTRAKPGLLSDDARLANRNLFASSRASFEFTEALRHAVTGRVAESVSRLDEEALTRYVKALARYFGAVDVGVTSLKPVHVYTHTGRGTGNWGEPIQLDHPWAIAFTVEMDHEMLAPSPEAPVVMESARQYAESARVAVQLAAALRHLGHDARAHIDGNYQVIAPLVAADAGLGQIGRMGLLITPRLGPRVRLGVVTTRAPLIPDQPSRDDSILDFCCLCRKCADNCPSHSIPKGPRSHVHGVLRWQIRSETCFRYWNVIGTDCAKCISVCPYAHPGHWMHQWVRWGLRQSPGFRRAALWMDDLFYGRRPKPRPAPSWCRLPAQPDPIDPQKGKTHAPSARDQ